MYPALQETVGENLKANQVVELPTVCRQLLEKNKRELHTKRIVPAIPNGVRQRVSSEGV